MTTPIWALDDLTSAQVDKFTTVNKNMRRIEALSSRVLSRTNGGPPGSIIDGDAYIVDVLSGSWAGFALDDVVVGQAGAWLRYTPTGEGIAHLYVNDENIFITYSGSAWIDAGGTSGTDPSSAVLAVSGSLNDGTNLLGARGNAIQGGYAYVTSFSGDKLNIIDIRDKSAPAIVATLTDATNLDGAADLEVVGNYAYIACNAGDRLTIVDISNANAPTVVGTVQDVTNLNGIINVVIRGRYAYCSCYDGDTFTVVDVSNPQAPVVAATLTDATNLNGAIFCAIQGEYAYVAGYEGDSMSVIDISDPLSPTRVGGVSGTQLDGATGVAVQGRYVYIGSELRDSLVVIDALDPTTPAIVGEYLNANMNGAGPLQVRGNYVYCGTKANNSIRIIDVSDPTSPTEVNGLQDNTNLDGISSLSVVGNHAYATAFDSNRFTIVDLKGASFYAAIIDSLKASYMEVVKDVFIGNRAAIGNSLNVGPGGIQSQGDVSTFGNATVQKDGEEVSVTLTRSGSGASKTKLLSGNGLGALTTVGAYDLLIGTDEITVFAIEGTDQSSVISIPATHANAFGVVEGVEYLLNFDTDTDIISIGNATINPDINFLGTGTVKHSGPVISNLVSGAAEVTPYRVQWNAGTANVLDGDRTRLRITHDSDTTADALEASIDIVSADVTHAARKSNIIFRTMNNGVLNDVLSLKDDRSVFSSGTTSTVAQFSYAAADEVFFQLMGSVNSVFFGMTAGGEFTVQTPGSSFSDKLTVSPTGLTTAHNGLNVTGDETVTGKGAYLIPDNTADAFELRQGGDNYLKVTTTDASEKITLGNATTNPDLELLGGGTATFGGSVVVTGDLTVNGTATTVNTTNLDVDDALIALASGNTGTTLDIGIIGERDSGNNTAWFFDESADEWVAAFTTSTSSDTAVAIGSYAPVHVGEFKAEGVTGLADGATGPTVFIDASSSETATDQTFPHLVLVNQDTTNNNHIKMGFTDSANGGFLVAAMDVIISDHTNNYGVYTFFTRGTDGFLSRLAILEEGEVRVQTGDLDLVLANKQYKHDGVGLSSLLWVSATAAASTLDGAGSVTLKSSTGVQQYKIRELRLVGGGTNFGAGGDRTITVSDGTTTWTTIPNATIESLPADTARWGDTEIPFNGGTSDTASAAGASITIQYAGGTTDHGGTGSLTIVACLEKVA